MEVLGASGGYLPHHRGAGASVGGRIRTQIENAADAVTIEKIKQVAHKYLWDKDVISISL